MVQNLIPPGSRHRLLARDVIEAMREPTEEMYGDKIGEALQDSDPTNVWQAMIDAILETGK